jgi:hypothetical protein
MIRRAYAYEVFPTDGEKTRGGVVYGVQNLQVILDDLFDALNIGNAPVVDGGLQQSVHHMSCRVAGGSLTLRLSQN